LGVIALNIFIPWCSFGRFYRVFSAFKFPFIVVMRDQKKIRRQIIL